MAGGTGSIVRVAGPAMIIGLRYSVGSGWLKGNDTGGGCWIVAASTTALIGVGVGAADGVGVGVAVTTTVSF